MKWRTDRDSNPGDGLPPTHFPGVRLRPLGHLSVGGRLANNHGKMQDPFAGFFQFLRTAHRTIAAKHSNAAAKRIIGLATPWAKAKQPLAAIPTNINAPPNAIASLNGVCTAFAAAQSRTEKPKNSGDARRVMNCTASSASTP